MIDPTKEYRTRGGDEVRIYAMDGEASYPIHGAVKYNGEWIVETWTADGVSLDEEKGSFDLIEVKPVREAWVNIYPPGVCHGYPSREMADRHALVGRIACIKITYSEGEGL